MVSHVQQSRVSAMHRRDVSATFAIVSELYLSLENDLGREFRNLLCSGDHGSLLTRSVNPDDYSDASTFRDDYLAVELMSKFPNLNVDCDREAVALSKFSDAELQCSETNKRLRLDVGSIFTALTPLGVISLARCKIEALLGSFSWDLAEQHFSFGPGSTTSLPRIKGDAYFKFGAVRPHVTKACSVLSLLAVKRVPRWFSHLAGLAGEIPEALEQLPLDLQVEKLFDVVPGNRVTTVPKNAKTDRVIAIEPDLNMYVQKGIGSLIRSRLLRVGIDLNDQTRNQVLACEGSRTGALATIDLSSASDTVSLELVERLLPESWFSAIKLCRSPRGVLPNGSLIDYQKVSSMGNGFTFELESLIFWALCSSVIELYNPTERRLAVYGDDIILSSSIYVPVKFILEFCGFSVNPKKSFFTGPFRESCGKHFFKGVDVTPFYVREVIETPDRIIWFANSVRSYAIRRYSDGSVAWGLDGRFHNVYCKSVSFLPKVLQTPSIPRSLGDIALWGDLDEASPAWDKRLHSLTAVGVADIRATFEPGEIPYLLRCLSALERRSDEVSTVSGSSSRGVCKPFYKKKWKLVKVPVTQWESYGPWYGP